MWLASLALLPLAGCATQAPASLSFSPQAETGLAIVVTAPTDAASTTIFRRVDLATNTFLKDIETVATGGIGKSNRIADYKAVGAALTAQEFAPGDYALVELTQPTFSGYATGMATLCLGAPVQAPVFRIEPGTISVLRIDTFSSALSRGALSSAKGDEEIRRAASDALKGYPGVSGEAELGEPVATISWPRKRGNAMETMLRNCAEPDGFSQTPQTFPRPPAASP